MSKFTKLQEKLDKEFSLYIRYRDADDRGLCKCISCGKYYPIKEIHCGHYISRRHLSTRWEEKNCAAQCVGCNIFNQGNGPGFAQGLIAKYGAGILDELTILKNRTQKWTAYEYELMIRTYQQKTKDAQNRLTP